MAKVPRLARSTGMAALRLVKPDLAHLPGYVDALRRGWSPNNVRGRTAALEELAMIEADPAAFVASLDDPEALGPPVPMADGSVVPRLPGYRRWLWDGELVGSIGFRWQAGTPALPPYCLGHIGYAVVPWKQGRGHATAAVLALLDDARARGLPYVEVTTNPDNLASQAVIRKAGGVFVEPFVESAANGGRPALRFRIPLA